MNNRIFVATTTFNAVVAGQQALIKEGLTRVREGHELLASYPDYFAPLDVHYDIEDGSARPGHKRAGKRSAPKRAGKRSTSDKSPADGD